MIDRISSSICCYKDETSIQCHTRIPILPGSFIVSMDMHSTPTVQSRAKLNRAPHVSFYFEIVTPCQVFQFCALTKDELMRWLAAISLFW